MCRTLSIIGLEHSYGMYGSRIFDPTQLAPLGARQGPTRIYHDFFLLNLGFLVFAWQQKEGNEDRFWIRPRTDKDTIGGLSALNSFYGFRHKSGAAAPPGGAG